MQVGLLLPGYMPRGVVAITTDLADTAYVGNTEVIVYQLPFVAAPKRIYKVQFRVGRADTDSGGDNTNSAIRYAKQSLVARCRWASASTVTTSNPHIGEVRVTTFDDDSSTATGIDAHWFLLNPPAGQSAVGIGIWAARSPATGTGTIFGQVRCLADGNAHLAIEDVGPYSE
ncbi:hypothetical protein SEA_HANK144_24 [Streptomyces phage Hank144]|uniref:DUF7298 domain-containing protein n=1 Tax=Streptomyces phage Hank144 TaxID=2301573 RepID=A0A385DNV8_9CAUD|nr:hypothetical protein KGG76_gp24 [Streptomyces phage Hank144]AXQ61080.1 hypothetical protein SEA_HANK144_24 [Streptomyces phage Hank144]